ncbi:MAG: HU family DNA-binding protein [Candidatus Omnitrophica bacterium]|nr:HU family DNA-binding protein [Candidatus Omnitrophota bacterium]
MNKAELVAAIAAKTKLSKANVAKVIDGFIEAVKKALRKRDKVQLIGLGSFLVRSRKARKGRNPQTGEEIKIKAKRVPAFVAGAALKKAVK